MKKICMIAGVLALAASVNAFADYYYSNPALDDFYRTYVNKHLSIGLRISHFSFTDPSKKTYDADGNLVGGYTRGISTYNLDERQSSMPAIYLMYDFNQYIALQVAWEHVEGRAWTLDTADPHYDGDLTLSGPSFLLRGSYPNDSIFTPFAGFGLAFLSADFDAESSWSAGGFRNMEADDTIGMLISGGVSADVYENVIVDLSISYMGADADARYWLRGEDHDRATWTFPASSFMLQLGVRYMF